MHSPLLPNKSLDLLVPYAPQEYAPSAYGAGSEGNRIRSWASTISKAVPSSESYGRARQASRNGLRTPPPDMSGAQLNPLLPNGYGTNSVVQIGPTNPYASTIYRTDMGGAGRASSVSTIQPVPIDRSRTRLHSPDSRLGPLIPPPEQAHRRKRSNSIVGHLQIPSSINNSKGSLAEFAAQVRFCRGTYLRRLLTTDPRLPASSGSNHLQRCIESRRRRLPLHPLHRWYRKQYPPWAFKSGSLQYSRQLRLRKTSYC